MKVINRLLDRSAVVAVFGLGYVGLPLVRRFVDVGFKVIGFDVDESKIAKLSTGVSYIEAFSNRAIASLIECGFEATSNFCRVREADVLIICVPTPLTKQRDPDLRYVISTLESVLPFLASGQVLSLESTTYPGTTEEVIRPKLEQRGFTIGDDFFLIYSPEREDPGNTEFRTKNTPKVVGGSTKQCLEVGATLYRQIVDNVVTVTSTKVAEMTKLLENIHRAVNIGLVNEMKIVADRMGIDIHEVIDAAATKPFGFTAFYPGPGLGGHCIPVDPFYLTWKAREYGLHTRFIELAGEINASMPAWVVGKTIDALNRNGKALKDSRVLLLGLAYKKDVDDMRESPSVKVLEDLVHRGARVEYSDPHVPSFPSLREYRFELNSVELTKEKIAEYDAILLLTDHSSFDFDLIKEHARLLVDTRGVYRSENSKIVRA